MWLTMLKDNYGLLSCFFEDWVLNSNGSWGIVYWRFFQEDFKQMSGFQTIYVRIGRTIFYADAVFHDAFQIIVEKLVKFQSYSSHYKHIKICYDLFWLFHLKNCVRWTLFKLQHITMFFAGLIYAWQGLAVVYCCSLLFRKSDGQPLYMACQFISSIWCLSYSINLLSKCHNINIVICLLLRALYNFYTFEFLKILRLRHSLRLMTCQTGQ